MITESMVLYGLAILIAIMYIPAVLNPKTFRKEMISLCSDRKSLYVLSGVILLMGFLILSVEYNLKAVSGWNMLVPLIGWATILKSAIFIWCPDFIKNQVKTMYNNDQQVRILAVFVLLISVGLYHVATNLI